MRSMHMRFIGCSVELLEGAQLQLFTIIYIVV